MQKRIIGFFCVFMFALGGMCLRVLYLEKDGEAENAAVLQSSRTVTVTESRAGIFDRDGNPLVNDTYEWKAVVFPSEADLSSLKTFVTDKDFMERVKTGLPVVANTDGKVIDGNGIHSFKVPVRYSEEQSAAHIIGYISDGKGVSGIEKAYDELLSAVGPKFAVTYYTDGHGEILNGEDVSFDFDNADKKSGVLLTLSTEIQSITESVLKSELEKGAAVVMDAQTGEILASASVPCFSPSNIKASLSDKDAPFINRAFSAYTVGSTWKLVVAAAALESGVSPQRSYDCTAGLDVEGVSFHCHWEYGHGEIDMPTALRVSCNPYFIDLGISVGSKKLLEMAGNMGFGIGTELAPELFTSAGRLPSEAELGSAAALASFSFGQGTLMATPVQMAAMAASIANGGCTVTPKLVLGIADDEALVTEALAYEKNRVMSESTAAKLREMMISVVEDGSGTKAKPKIGGAGGKTASAQTGQYDGDGNEIIHAWFVGFYPAENPEYAIAVFAEGMNSGSEFAAPVFKKICDGIAQLNTEKK